MSSQDVPIVPELKGAAPGVLDPTQPTRLLRRPDSTLSFASFDPNIAVPYNIAQLGNLSLDEHCRPKRIVIETMPEIGSYWRWVPRARLRAHVADEGTFPRMVRVCGEQYVISQEQWDIYKLDPLYDCFVDDFSCLSVISKKDSASYDGFNFDTNSNYSSARPDADSQPQPSSKNLNEKVEDDMMEIDDDNTPYSFQLPPKPRPRRKRSPPFAFNFGTDSSATSPPISSKRNANVSFQNLRDPDEEETAYHEQDNENRNTKQFIPKLKKRARTMSPSSSQRAAFSHRNKRKTAKQTRMEREKAERIFQRERNLEREILADVFENYSGSSHAFEDILEEQEEAEAEAEAEAEIRNAPPSEPEEIIEEEEEEEEMTEARRIAESRRKMEELNADRQRQRQREKVFREEKQEEKQGGRRAHSEAPSREQLKRQKTEEERRQAESKIKEDMQRQAKLRQEEMRRKAASAAAESEERHRPWDGGIWDKARAVERYRHVGQFFDKARFSSETLPLTMIDIPWPTLRHPRENTPRDMDWETVAVFFANARDVLRGQEYKDIMKASFHRFHPDRWSSRNLFIAILDEQERDEILTAVSAVSKAIGALYADARGN